MASFFASLRRRRETVEQVPVRRREDLHALNWTDGGLGVADADYLARLSNFLEQAAPGHEFTFEALYRFVQPPAPQELAAALARLVAQGTLRQIVRVESPTTHGGIGDYDSIQQIPDKLHDWRADGEIMVRPEDLRFLYIPAWKNSHSPSLALR